MWKKVKDNLKKAVSAIGIVLVLLALTGLWYAVAYNRNPAVSPDKAPATKSSDAEQISQLQEQMAEVTKILDSKRNLDVVQVDESAAAGHIQGPAYDVHRIIAVGGDGSIAFSEELTYDGSKVIKHGEASKGRTVATKANPGGFSWESTSQEALAAASARLGESPPAKN